MPRHIACLSFDFDTWSGFAARGMTTPTPVSRGEFGVVGAARILDLGTGLRYFGAEMNKPGCRVNALVSHLHWDHIQGLPFFAPMLRADTSIGLWAPRQSDGREMGEILDAATKPLAEVLRGYTPFRDGDVIFAKITPCMENGKAAIAKGLTNGCGYGSTEFHVLRPGPYVTAEWVFFLLRTQSYPK